MSVKKYRITIKKRGYIPGIGQGPIIKPIYVSQMVYDNLIKLGYPVEIVGSVSDTAKTIAEKLATKEIKEEKAVEKPKKEKKETKKVVEPEPEEEIVEEVAEEEEESEVVTVNDPDFSAESYYQSSFLTSKNVCKKILNARKVQYDDDSTLKELKNLVLESNPDVEFEEE